MDLGCNRKTCASARSLQNVPMAFADIPPFAVFGLDEEPALLLGTDLMETFRKVSLDFDKRGCVSNCASVTMQP